VVESASPVKFSSLVSGKLSCELVIYDHSCLLSQTSTVQARSMSGAVPTLLSVNGFSEDDFVFDYCIVAKFTFGNYLVCNIFYEVELRPRHAPQALQSTSKPDRPQLKV
jgi:hypothetical protein